MTGGFVASVKNKVQGLREVWAFDNRWHLILARLFFPGDRICVYRTAGLDILVDHGAGDANGARNVLASPMYTDHLSHLRLDGPIRVLDIGANNGGFSLLLRSRHVEIEKLVCVELNPRTCIRLRFNLDRNIPGQHEVVNAAVCGQPRVVEVALGPGGVDDSIYAASGNADCTFKIPGRTFDDLYRSAFGEEPIDLCKMDVEQAEYEVFDAPGHDLLSRCRYLVIEIHEIPGRSVGDVVRSIVECGFRELPLGSDRSVHCFVNTRSD